MLSLCFGFCKMNCGVAEFHGDDLPPPSDAHD
jgi:hypothetical protein